MTLATPGTARAPRLALKLAGLAGALAVLGVLLAARLAFPEAFSADAVQAAVPDLGVWGPALFVAAFVVATLALLPTSPLAVAAGLLFGPALGFGLAWLAAMLGSVAAYGLARAGGLGVRSLLERRARGLVGVLDSHSLRAVMASRLFLLPLGPVSYALGLARVGPRAFLWGTALGILPLVMAFALVGSALGDLARLRSPAFLAAFALALLVAAFGAWRGRAPPPP